MRRALLICVALVAIPSGTWAQGHPLGPEFPINTFTTGFQGRPSVAADPSGDFIVVWGSDQDGSVGGVFGQRYASSGSPLGPEFRVNTYTAGNQGVPSVAAAAGSFVVTWTSPNQDGSGSGIFAQRYASSGSPSGPEFRVNTFTPTDQLTSSVAADAVGNFVIVWVSNVLDGSAFGIFGRRYASSGAPLGPEFRVNTYTTGIQSVPSVAADSAGNFVVIWHSETQDGSGFGVFGQRYASSGAPVGPEFRVNTYSTGYQENADVAADSSGNFVVTWVGDMQDGSGDGVFGQRYAGTGSALGPEFRVNTYTTGIQTIPSVAADASGNFVVTWRSVGQDGSIDGVFGQRYASSGIAQGPEFRVNTYTTNDQFLTAVAADTSGNFVVVWSSVGQDGSGYGVFGQRFGQIVPVELSQFRVE